MGNQLIYLDNNATTKPSDKVLAAMAAAPWGNSNSLHKLGMQAKAAVMEAEIRIRKAINAHEGHIMWTSGGAEANYYALHRDNYYPGTRLICPSTEHKSVLESTSLRATMSVDTAGSIEPKALIEEAYVKHCNTVALMMVNNETGLFHGVQWLRTYAGKHSSLKIHTDAVQALGKVHVDVDHMRVDTLSISAHKIHGPKGIGCLWSRNELPGYRKMNTLPVSSIVGFGIAAEELGDPMETHDHCESLRDKMVSILSNELNLGGREFNSCMVESIPSTLNVTFSGIDAFFLTQNLSDEGVYVSMGSACNAGEDAPSHVLTAMGLSKEDAMSSIRISFSRENTLDEVEIAAQTIASCVKDLRGKK